MDKIALNIIQRVSILEGLFKLDNDEIFVTTLHSFINTSINKMEKSYLLSALIEYQNQNSSQVFESLNYIRINFINKIFNTACDKKWNSLTPTNNSDIKFCSDCKRNVFKVYNKDDYRKRKQLNQCVAISFFLNDKFTEGTACEFTEYTDFELLGSPSIIDQNE